MKRTQNEADIRQVLSVIEDYNTALTLLDNYDHQCMKRPQGNKAIYVLNYEECRKLIDQMRFNADSDLFGHEKDDSFKGSIGNIYQSFSGEDVYPSLEEKAANLLYFVTKNHSFSVIKVLAAKMSIRLWKRRLPTSFISSPRTTVSVTATNASQQLCSSISWTGTASSTMNTATNE